ncbi:trypsin-like peptidase domain-containing protein [Actinospica robiniae]|uniref:trypsin-like peptidase domain-containing protein n=1 Tax=Actinospica robiniae TaxID=304901 RepID=UPI0003F9C0E2|nr:trypsin-like peptidase domain-containing protein [Actinospica robiniae]
MWLRPAPARRVPAYLGRVLDAQGRPDATCFQFALGYLATAKHALGGLAEGQVLTVDPLSGGDAISCTVIAIDDLNDLAVLHTRTPLGASVPAMALTDTVPLGTSIVVVGVSAHVEEEHEYRYLESPGSWAGLTQRDGLSLGRFNSQDVTPGMSGAPVCLRSDHTLLGIVLERYASGDGRLRDAAWAARTEALRDLGERVGAGTPKLSKPIGRQVKPRTAVLVLIIAIALVAGLAFALRPSWDGHAATGVTNPAASPIAAPSNALPLSVQNVADIESSLGDGSFALGAALPMSISQLQTFNTVTVANSGKYGPWYHDMNGAAIDFGYTTMDLRNTTNAQVSVTGMSVLKSCSAPLKGTLFSGYTQGTGDNVEIAFNLDGPNPMSQDMFSSEPLGTNYFAAHTITLDPGESRGLTVGAYTKQYSCTFTLRVFVSTARGPFWQDIDDNGRPFRVTAMPPTRSVNAPYAGYQVVYVSRQQRPAWTQVDPATYSN